MKISGTSVRSIPLPKKFIALAVALLVVLLYAAMPGSAFAHSGGTNAQGCHLNHKTNRTHCHNKDSKSKKTKTKATKAKATKARAKSKTKATTTKSTKIKSKKVAKSKKIAKKCKAGTILNNKTNRCVKIVCEAGSKFNKKTNRCNKIKCPKGSKVNLKTNRCNKVAASKTPAKKSTTKKK
jgi:hypothetical protein